MSEDLVVDIEFDLDEDMEIEIHHIEKGGFQESVEVIPDEFVDFKEVESYDEGLLDNDWTLPCIRFVSDVSVQQIKKIDDNEMVNVTKVYNCKYCGKLYKREMNYVKHMSLCDVLTSNHEKSIVDNMDSTISRNEYLPLSFEEIKKVSKAILFCSLKEIINDPINNIKIPNTVTKGNKIAKLAAEILLYIETRSNALDQANGFIDHLSLIVYKTDLSKSQSREKMWHQVIMDNQNQILQKYFSELFDFGPYSSSVQSGMLFDLCFRIMKNILKENSSSSSCTVSLSMENLGKVSVEEKQIVYYVSGYLIFSLIEKYKKLCENKKNVIAQNALQFLMTLKCYSKDDLQGTFIEDYVKKWIDIVNRGGLVKANEEFFNFILHIETVVQNFMTIDLLKKYRNEDLRDFIKARIEKVPVIKSTWASLSRDLPNEKLSDILFSQVITKWIDIRAKAFVTTYLQIIKRKINSMSAEKKKSCSVQPIKKGVPALRKTLAS